MSNKISHLFTFNKSDSNINNSAKKLYDNKIKENNVNIKSSEELNNIFNLILSESSKSTELKYTTNELLSIFIRRNRNKINETFIEISQFFSTNKINSELLVQCLDGIFNSLMENNQIIDFINLIVPVLVKYLYQNKNQNLSSINKLYSFIGKLIKQGGLYIRELIENKIEILLEEFNFNEDDNNINEGKNKSISISIQLLMLKRSALTAFSSNSFKFI